MNRKRSGGNGRPFKKGCAPGPGRGNGRRSAKTIATVALPSLSDEEKARLKRAFIDAIEGGDGRVIAACASHFLPPCQPPVTPFPLGSLSSLEDCRLAMIRVAEAAASGEIDESRASGLERRILSVAKITEAAVIETRLVALETRLATGGPRRFCEAAP